MTLSAPCGAARGGVLLNMGGEVVLRLLVGGGGRLVFQGPGLQLTNSPTAARHPIWPVSGHASQAGRRSALLSA